MVKKQKKRAVAPSTRVKQNAFVNELIRQNFNLTKTFDKSRVGRATYYTWLKDDTVFAEAIEALREQEVDLIEDAFRDLVKDRNPQVVMFGLKTRGAKRGYQEKQQVEHFGDGIQIQFNEPSDKARKVLDADCEEIEDKGGGTDE